MRNFFSRFWHVWKKVGQAIGDFIARVALSLFYFTIFLPFALGVRLFSDPLDVKRRSQVSGWLERSTRDLSIEDARRQS